MAPAKKASKATVGRGKTKKKPSKAAASGAGKSKAASKKKAKKKVTTKKKTPAKKSTAKKSTAKKSTAKKTAAKKTAAKKSTTKKTVAKKTAPSATKKKATKKKAKAAKSSAAPKKTTKTPASKVPVKKPTLKKTSSTPAARAGLPAAPDKPLPPLAKRISKKDRDTIRKRLIEQHNILVGSIDTIEAEYLGTNDNQTTKGGDEADQATTALTADLSLRLAESESKVLKDINLAISKLDDGSYGVCEVTGAPIEVRRLLAMPWARLSLEAQERVEQQQLSYDESFGWVASDEF